MATNSLRVISLWSTKVSNLDQSINSNIWGLMFQTHFTTSDAGKHKHGVPVINYIRSGNLTLIEQLKSDSSEHA